MGMKGIYRNDGKQGNLLTPMPLPELSFLSFNFSFLI